MIDINRSGGVGRCALALFVLVGSLGICLGQIQTPNQSAADAQATKDSSKAKQDAPPAQGTKEDTAAKPAAVPPQDTPAATATPPAQVAPQASDKPSVAEQPKGKGKRSSKKGKNATEATGPGQFTTQAVQDKPYIIGPEDMLGLNVLHVPDVSQILEVRPDGLVAVRFIGEQMAAGLTTQQLSEAIAEKLKTYYNNPEVNIQVIKINSKKYYVTGEVTKGGAYALTAPKTVYQAVIEAGIGPFAKKGKIFINRGQGKINFNFTQVTKGQNLQQNILLQDGDVIVVP